MLWNLPLLAQQAAPPAAGTSWDLYWKLAVAAGVVILSYLAGRYFSRRLRMPDHGWKISVVTLALLAGIAITTLGWPPKLGIDLKGGVILVYEFKPPKVGQPEPDMDKLVRQLRTRVDPSGTKQIIIRPAGLRQIEIIIPEVDSAEVEATKQRITQLGTLEFRVLANVRDHDRIIKLAKASDSMEVRDPDGTVIARWVPVEQKPQTIREFTTPRPPDHELSQIVYRQPDSAKPNRVQVLVIVDPFHVTGEYLTRVGPTTDEQGGNAVKFVFNSEGAKRFGQLTRLNRPRGDNNRRQLAIILNEELVSAPSINDIITSNGIISGNFTRKERDELIAVLDEGKLDAELNRTPISEIQCDATIGSDNVQKGKWSMIVSMILVLVFTLVYYRFSGLVACAALLANLVISLAIMISVKAAFTMPGFAGLVLSVGMAVDANVLIYERFREELARGAALRMAIRNGFDRAWVTIFDSNVTTILTAVILYIIGTDQIKGFATVLILSLVTSMFTAVFCARVAFEIAEKRRWIKDLKMMKFLTATNFDFLRVYKPALLASVVVVAIGLVAAAARGKHLLDIDFTGGTAAQVLFKEGERAAVTDVNSTVRQWNETLARADKAALVSHLGPRLTEQLVNLLQAETPAHQRKKFDQLSAEEIERLREMASLPDVTISELHPEEDPRSRFWINTSNRELLAVEGVLEKLFEGRLAANSMTYKLAQANISPPAAPAANPSQGGAGQPADGAARPADGAAPPGAGDETSRDGAAAPGEGAAKPGEGAPPPGDDASQSGDDADEPGADAPAGAAEQNPSTAGQPDTARQPRDAAPGAAQPDPAGDAAAPAQPKGAGNAAQPPAGAGDAAPPTGCAVSLQFDAPISQHAVLELLKRSLDTSIVVDVTNPELQPGSRLAFRNWTARFNAPYSGVESALQAAQKELATMALFPGTNNIGSQVAGGLRTDAAGALLASLVGIVIYLWVRFQKVSFGLAAVVALVHDVMVTFAALAMSSYLGFIPTIDPFKINLDIMAAFLTIIGYSLNDTIVIFDRIREVKGKSPQLTPAMVNLAVNQTLSRTILTFFITFIVVAALYFFGGSGIHGFAFAMLVGLFAGTYSTVYIASPVLLWLTKSPKEALAPPKTQEQLQATGV
jgi:SecD/SecF fusion protein